jgi:1,4-alpha-glucan branching enzyme
MKDKTVKSKNQVNEVPEIADNLQPMSRRYSGDKTRCRVAFWFPAQAAPDATSVAVAGSFNDWKPDQHFLKRTKTGDFSLELELPAGQEYPFRFVIDGVRWENAWNADKYVWCDHAQCENSVIAT